MATKKTVKKTAAKKPPAKKKLTPKQEKFVDEYAANGGNGAKAARDAYPEQTEEAARVTASRLLTNANIQARIQARTDDAASLKAEEVVGVLSSHLRSDLTDLLPDDGGVISDIKEKGLGHLVKKIKVRREIESGTLKQFELVEIELHGSQTAAIQLSKILGIEREKRPNEADYERFEAAIKAQMEETGEGRDKAIERLAKANFPGIEKFVQSSDAVN